MLCYSTEHYDETYVLRVYNKGCDDDDDDDDDGPFRNVSDAPVKCIAAPWAGAEKWFRIRRR